MIDISSSGAAFTYHADENCPHPGQYITARFSIPYFKEDDSFDMANFTRNGYVRRVDQVNGFIRRVAIQFAESLPFKPGQKTNSSKEMQQKFQAVIG